MLSNYFPKRLFYHCDYTRKRTFWDKASTFLYINRWVECCEGTFRRPSNTKPRAAERRQSVYNPDTHVYTITQQLLKIYYPQSYKLISAKNKINFFI